MEDKILELFFSPERWEKAIGRGCLKGIRKDQLYQLAKPEVRAGLCALIRQGKYAVSPPHTAKIPKEGKNEYRTVYVNEPLDRVMLSIANDLLFDLCPEMVHPQCMSYLKGVGCGQVVQKASRMAVSSRESVIGWKSDLSKYFDSVPLRYIDAVFDSVEQKHGRSAIIDILRTYYHSDVYYDSEENAVRRNYQSLKQGCAVAAFLADAILYHIDEALSSMGGYYVRYSDDMLYIGGDHAEAMSRLEAELEKMGMRLNPKKVETLSRDRWFRFLGFSIKGADISLSSSRIKKIQEGIEAVTTRDRKATPGKALRAVNRLLYGSGAATGRSWAMQVLPTVNVRKDIDTLNGYILDCLRAVETGRRRVGGLGYVSGQAEGCIARGRGRNVASNRERTRGRIEGYLSLGCMWEALRKGRGVYDALLSTLE